MSAGRGYVEVNLLKATSITCWMEDIIFWELSQDTNDYALLNTIDDVLSN